MRFRFGMGKSPINVLSVPGSWFFGSRLVRTFFMWQISFYCGFKWRSAMQCLLTWIGRSSQKSRLESFCGDLKHAPFLNWSKISSILFSVYYGFLLSLTRNDWKLETTFNTERTQERGRERSGHTQISIYLDKIWLVDALSLPILCMCDWQTNKFFTHIATWCYLICFHLKCAARGCLSEMIISGMPRFRSMWLECMRCD